jgi:hypothetical protein
LIREAIERTHAASASLFCVCTYITCLRRFVCDVIVVGFKIVFNVVISFLAPMGDSPIAPSGSGTDSAGAVIGHLRGLGAAAKRHAKRRRRNIRSYIEDGPHQLVLVLGMGSHHWRHQASFKVDLQQARYDLGFDESLDVSQVAWAAVPEDKVALLGFIVTTIWRFPTIGLVPSNHYDKISHAMQSDLKRTCRDNGSKLGFIEYPILAAASVVRDRVVMIDTPPCLSGPRFDAIVSPILETMSFQPYDEIMDPASDADASTLPQVGYRGLVQYQACAQISV